MKKFFAPILFLLLFSSFSDSSFQTNAEAFTAGEYLKYRVHYMGVTGGYASLKLENQSYQNQPHYHAVGKGWSVGATNLVFKIKDNYETYLNKSTFLPSKFVRKIDEGGYTKNKILYFDQSNKKVLVDDKKNNNKKTYQLGSQVQDIFSAFYYLRSLGHESFYTGDYKKINVFMDEEIFTFKVKVLGREVVKTKYGKIKTIKLRPYVQKGRVFKEEESLTFWVTDDSNMMPVLIKANLLVGSLKAEINSYSNLKATPNFY